MTDTTKTAPAPAAAIPKIRDQRIYAAFPSYGGTIHSPFALSLLQLTQQPSAPIAQIEFLNGDSLVSRARNKLAKFFLNGRPNIDANGNQCLVMYDWLLFIDTDLIFQPHQVVELYQYAVAHGPNIYCGAYPLKKLAPKVVFNPMPGAAIDADGVLEVREAGTGMMLVHREVFEKMAEHFAHEIAYESDQGALSGDREREYDFFSVGVRMDPVLKYRRYLSEDWFFCQRWREIGGRVLMQTRLQCQHIGQLTYPANPGEIMEAARVYEAGFKEQAEAKARAQIEKAQAEAAKAEAA